MGGRGRGHPGERCGLGGLSPPRGAAGRRGGTPGWGGPCSPPESPKLPFPSPKPLFPQPLLSPPPNPLFPLHILFFLNSLFPPKLLFSPQTRFPLQFSFLNPLFHKSPFSSVNPFFPKFLFPPQIPFFPHPFSRVGVPDHPSPSISSALAWGSSVAFFFVFPQNSQCSPIPWFLLLIYFILHRHLLPGAEEIEGKSPPSPNSRGPWNSHTPQIPNPHPNLPLPPLPQPPTSTTWCWTRIARERGGSRTSGGDPGHPQSVPLCHPPPHFVLFLHFPVFPVFSPVFS